MKRNISVLLAVILLLSALASVPAGAGAVEDTIRAEIYGEESAGTSVDADIFSPMPGVGEDDAPAMPTVQDKPALAATGVEKTVTDYTYEITPLLAPFNTFFFVKTDNPDPMSFRFLDSESVYFEKEDETDALILYQDTFYEKPIAFADV